MKPYLETEGATIYLGNCFEIVPTLANVDHLIADPPYSERTHRGHDASKEIADRRAIDYGPWSVDDVQRFVEASRLSVPGWRVVFSDHVLQPAWEAFFRAAGLYAFAPLPYVATGSRTRFRGDGPASWTVWITVARPIEARFVGWGTLPGSYVLPAGRRDKGMVVGGKPEWLMRELISDYTREGETVLDPVCGSGTTLVSALQVGRKAVGIESSERSCEIAAKRIEALGRDRLSK